MTNTRNQKDQLAKLMATENITIVHKPIPTAYFDVKNRILACPTFKDDISPELYDLFMGHEVGHALNTPYEGLHNALTKNKTLKGYLNVVEDVRIEKAIKQKFQGLRKSFYAAYNELQDKDFFGIAKRDLQELSLIDKINLITKCGSRVSIKLTSVEHDFLLMAEECSTWEEVVVCAEAIYEWSKENETRDENDEALVPQTTYEDMMDGDEDEEEEGSDSQGGDEEYDDETSDSEESDEESDSDNLPEAPEYGDGGNEEEDTDDSDEDDDSEESSRKVTGGKEGGTGSAEDFDDATGARESITEHNAHNNEELFVEDTPTWREQINLRDVFKQKNMSSIVVPHDTVLADWKKYWEVDAPLTAGRQGPKNERRAEFTAKKLTDKNKKLIHHMAKEFEMRQTAMRSVKAFSGKTGQLDMNRLAKYQIVDDIFKRVTYLPDGMNHGVNVLIDWSGSISSSCADLLEQGIILAQFCRIANIPHRIYLFTDSYSKYDERFGGEGKLVEIFSNEMNNKKFTAQLKNVASLWNNHYLGKFGWRLHGKSIVKYNEFFNDAEFTVSEDDYIYFPTDVRPEQYRLGGTPLNHCLVAMRKLLPEFNSAYQIEKSILTIITDGYSHNTSLLEAVDKDAKYDWAKTAGVDSWDINEMVELIDPYENKVYPYSEMKRAGRYRHSYGNDFKKTQNLLSWLSKTCNVTVTGFFCLEKKNEMADIMQFTDLKDSFWDMDRQLWAEVRKNGLVVNAHGYNKLFLTATSRLGTEGSDSLDSEIVGEKKSKVMAAFKRNQRAKTTSRFLTNEFIKEIS